MAADLSLAPGYLLGAGHAVRGFLRSRRGGNVDPTDPAKRQFPQLCVGSVVRRDAAISFIRIGSFLFRTLAVTADQLVQGF